jgi:serine/threonine-protein kinase
MVSPPRGVRRASGSQLSATVAGTEEARAFFQERLATLGLALFLLAGGSWAALAVLNLILIASGGSGEYGPNSLGAILHLSGAVLAAALWLSTRRGRRSPVTLHALDLTVTVGIATTFAATGRVLGEPTVGIFVGLLSFMTTTLTRAIVVPSTARRTLLIGLIAASAVLVLAAWRGPAGLAQAAWRVPPEAPLAARLVPAACWSAAGIAIGTLASHTIFGLRRQVDQARVLGQYQLESKIGEGGMGEVWRASHALLRRPTAIKLLPPGRAGEEAIRRFEREVQLTARLTHPNTVAIYDYGRTRDGIFYYAMELIEGMDLDRLVAEHGPLPPARVAHMLEQILGALAEAHDLGLVHRDIKPANVLLSPRKGEPEFAKLVDFGLVKTIEGVAPGAPPVDRTGTNTITGTPLYMSPEAIRAPATVDARSDLYSVGVVAWFLLVGRPPFGGHNLMEVCGNHLYTAPPRPSTAVGRTIPAELENAVMSCLEKQPDARPPDARALRDQLRASGAAQAWTAEAAAAWWRDVDPTAPQVAAAHAHTIALDVSARATLPPASHRP